MKFGLVQKLVIVIEIVVVAFAVFGGGVAYVVSRKSLVDRINSQLESVSVLKEHSINGFIEEVKAEIEYLGNGEETYKQLVLYLEEKNPTAKKLVVEEMEHIYKEKDIFTSIFLMNSDGMIVASTNSTDEGKIRSTEPYFLNSKDKTLVQDFYYDVAIGQTTLLIATPVKDALGKFLGTVVGRINIEEISSLMVERSGLGKSGETFIVNSSNVVVATELLKEPGEKLKRTLFLPQIDKCLSGQSNTGLNQTDYHGDVVLGYWRWLPAINSCLVTKIDQAEAFAPINNAAAILLAVVAVAGVLMGILGYITGVAIISPLIKLRDEAQKIKEGNLEAQCEVRSNDEIGEVAVAFNEMASKLKEMYVGLEDRVKEKTTELSKKLEELAGLNVTLGQNEKAMVNLLEDANLLEKQLEAEKAGVEKKVEERTLELTNTKTKLDSSIENLPLGFVMVDIHEELVISNPLASKLLGGKDKTNILAALKTTLGDKLDLGKYIKNCGREKRRLVLSDVELEGRILQFLLSPILTKEDNDVCIGVVILIQDITEAKILDRSKDEFFSIASHELRTPLTAIRGNTSMILEYYAEAIKDPELKAMVDDIHESSIRLIHIVNDFLNVSRLEQGKMVYDATAFDIEKIIPETIKEYDVTGSRKNLKIDFTPSATPLPMVLADVDKVRQVLINLLGNALKFTTEGGVIINTEVSGKFVKVLVTDTGRGIAEKQQSLLFHKFQQAGSNLFTRDTVGGTGLGLYISKMMVEGMRGELKLEKSEEGKGTTFSFSLPIATKDNQVDRLALIGLATVPEEVDKQTLKL